MWPYTASSNSMGPWFSGTLQAPHVRLAGVDARLRCLGGSSDAAGAVVARIAALGFLGSLALGVERSPSCRSTGTPRRAL